MEPFIPATITVLLVTLAATAAAFRNRALQERWIFEPRAILAGKQYARMITSGFIHADWMHFCMNAASFYLFADGIELIYGIPTLLAIYFSSILGGSLLSLLIHRHHDYRALGASGGVCGIIFAAIFLSPGTSVGFFFVPIYIPGWLYAPLFLIGSYLAHRKATDNVGHDAHLGGAVIGLLVAFALHPQMVLAQPWMFAAVVGLSVLVLWLMVAHPFTMPGWMAWAAPAVPAGGRERDYAQNRARRTRRERMDTLLDKVSKEGLHKLTAAERAELEKLSKEV